AGRSRDVCGSGGSRRYRAVRVRGTLDPMPAHLRWTAERPMRSVFMGTPAFAVPSLEALATVTDVVGVVSQPDKARGRGLESSRTPVAAVALERGYPLIRPARVRESEVLATLTDWRPD